MGNFYIDPVSGDDSNDGLGPYKAAFTSGGTAEIAVGDTVTGATSGKTAKVVLVVHGSGTWAGGDEAGTLYVGTPSGAFTNGENLNVSGKQDNIATLTADFVVASWKTITSGATAARIAPSDNIRIKKNTDPESLGVNATFTNDSATVTLSAAVTQLISDCGTSWSKSADVTQSTTTSILAMAGDCQQFVFGSGFSTGKVAWYDLGAGNELNLSAFQAVTFGFYSGTDIAAGMFTLKLCSDAAGDTAVDEFVINKAIAYDSSLGTMHRIYLNKGSALGSSIRSVALYANSDPGTITIRIDDINATNGLTHRSLIGKNDDWWMSIKSINGTTIILTDNYYGTTDVSPVPCYAINDFIDLDTATSYTTALNTLTDDGSEGSLITYQGGWDFSTNSQNGHTNYHALSDIGYVLYNSGSTYNRIENIRVRGGYNGIRLAGTVVRHEFSNIGIYQTNNIGLTCDGDAASVGKVEGTINVFDTGSYGLQLKVLQSVELLMPATLKIMSPSSIGLIVDASDGKGRVHATGDITVLKSVSVVGVSLKCASAFITKIISNSDYVIGNLNTGFTYINELEILANITTLVYAKAIPFSIGIVQIHNLVKNGFTLTNTLSELYMNGGRFCIDAIDGDATAFVGNVINGKYGDHVTMGQAAGWAYGGSGKSLVLSPSSTTGSMWYEVYIPVAASKTYKVTFQNIKSSSGANCTLTFDVDGCGITRIAGESVSLTDSWAKHSSADITTTRAGFIRVAFKALDGGTTGDIGLDEIKVEEQA